MRQIPSSWNTKFKWAQLISNPSDTYTPISFDITLSPYPLSNPESTRELFIRLWSIFTTNIWSKRWDYNICKINRRLKTSTDQLWWHPIHSNRPPNNSTTYSKQWAQSLSASSPPWRNPNPIKKCDQIYWVIVSSKSYFLTPSLTNHFQFL